MGLKKAKSLESGLEAPNAYTSIKKIEIMEDSMIENILFTYADKQACIDKKPPISRTQIILNSAELDNHPEIKTARDNLFRLIHKYAESKPEFDGAINEDDEVQG